MDLLRRFYIALCVLACFLISGCSTTLVDNNATLKVHHLTGLLVVPFKNNSETPEAGSRAMTMVADLLRAKGMSHVYIYPVKKSCDVIKSCENNVDIKKIRRWALRHHFRFLVTGSVNEWRYKVGLDGEPSVGTSVVLRDVLSDHIVWTSVGSRTGHSWSGLSDTAQNLLRQMLANIRVSR